MKHEYDLTILVLLLLMVVLLLAGFIWFDFLGILNAREVLAPVYGLIGIGRQTEVENVESASLLDQQRLLKLQQALAEAKGSWHDEEHPELAAGIESWRDELRQINEARWQEPETDGK